MTIRVVLILLLTTAASIGLGEQPNRSPELLLLDRFVGHWQVEYELKLADRAVQRQEFRSLAKWSADGTFVIVNERQEGNERLTVLRFDKAKKHYAGSLFSATGQSPFEAEWDESTKQFKMEFTTSDDADVTIVNRFLDEDHIDIFIDIRGKDENPNATVRGKQTRIAKPRSSPTRPKIEFRLAKEEPAANLERKPYGSANQFLYLDPKPVVTRADVLSAKFVVDEQRIPAFEFRLKPAGARRLGIATRDNRGERLAILVDGEVVHAPEIHSMITEGARMTGNFTQAMIEKFAPVEMESE